MDSTPRRHPSARRARAAFPRSGSLAALTLAFLTGALLAGACSRTVTGSATPDSPRIDDVTIAGNDNVDDDDILDGLANRGPEGLLRRIYRRLDRLALEQDIARVEAFYARRGFFSAKVVGTDVKPNGDKSVDVSFRVKEGQATRVAGLSISGLSKLLQGSKSLDYREGPLQPGQVFRHDRYLEFKQWLLSWLAHRGYPHARIDARVEVDRDAHTAEIRLVVDDGPLTRFGQTEVEGLARVPESAVRNRVAWEPGQRFDPELLELTQGRLYQLGMFSAVRMDYDKEGRPRISDIQIGLTEAPPRELRLGGGLAVEGGFSADNLRIQLRQRTDYIMRGIIDPLTSLHLEARPAWEWNLAESRSGPAGEATATINRADLFLPRMVGSATVGYQRDELEAYGAQGPNLRLGLNRPFIDDHLQVGIGWRFRYSNFFKVSPALNGVTPPSDPAQGGVAMETPSQAEVDLRTSLGLDADPYRLGALEQNVAYDLRDDPLDARRGVYAAIAVAEGHPAFASDFRFVRATGDLRGYLPIGRKLVLAGRLFYGRKLNNGPLPVTERFFDGGATGHRGFGFRRLSPFVSSSYFPLPEEGQPSAENPTTDSAPVGGDENFLGTAEVRYDIGKLLKYPFAVVGFTDFGDVICASDVPGCLPGGSLDLANLHWAVGSGVRWTPVIAIRLDIGYRLNRYEAGEPDAGSGVLSRIAYHISLGQAF